MEHVSLTVAEGQLGFADNFVKNEAYSSGVSWAAVIAGAFVAAALSLILLALGTGLGLSSVSPWSNVGASASTINTAAILWLIIIQMSSVWTESKMFPSLPNRPRARACARA